MHFVWAVLFCYPRNHVRKNPPSQQKVKSCSIFRSSTCYECVHFNKEDHLPQNGTLLTSPVFPSSQGSTAADCFNLDRHLVIAFSTTPPNANLTHTCLCCTRSKNLSRTSSGILGFFIFFALSVYWRQNCRNGLWHVAHMKSVFQQCVYMIISSWKVRVRLNVQTEDQYVLAASCWQLNC